MLGQSKASVVEGVAGAHCFRLAGVCQGSVRPDRRGFVVAGEFEPSGATVAPVRD